MEFTVIRCDTLLAKSGKEYKKITISGNLGIFVVPAFDGYDYEPGETVELVLRPDRYHAPRVYVRPLG